MCPRSMVRPRRLQKLADVLLAGGVVLRRAIRHVRAAHRLPAGSNPSCWRWLGSVRPAHHAAETRTA
eukprot:2194358-Heterocapsa_arctica.AAC.1